MVDVLVFDMDDTLFPEEEYVLSGYDAVSAWVEKKFQLKGFGNHSRRVYQSGIRNRVFNAVLSEMGIPFDAALVLELVDVYRSHKPAIRLFEDALWALEHYSRVLPLGLITDGYLKAQKNKFEALEIKDYFTKVIYTDELGRDYWKPSPVPYLKIEETIPAGTNGFAYVADNPLKDFIAARQLNWFTVRIERKTGIYRGNAVDPGADADVVIESLYQLPNVLRKANNTSNLE